MNPHDGEGAAVSALGKLFQFFQHPTGIHRLSRLRVSIAEHSPNPRMSLSRVWSFVQYIKRFLIHMLLGISQSQVAARHEEVRIEFQSLLSLLDRLVVLTHPVVALGELVPRGRRERIEFLATSDVVKGLR